MTYNVVFQEHSNVATVSVRVNNYGWLKQLSFNLKNRRLSNVRSNGSFEQKNSRLIWTPQVGNAYLEYDVTVDESFSQQDRKSFQAYQAPDWLIMRADDLVPPFKARITKGIRAGAQLNVQLPKAWQSVYTRYPREEHTRFKINSQRSVPRPKGWLIAGSNLVARHDSLGSTAVSIVGPGDHQVRPMELLALMGLIWPQFEGLIGDKLPEKLLLVSANDPLWRGGLSAGSSMFMHASRPLVSENGTSTLLHELFHVFSGIHSEKNHDWITEGLAEFYSVQWLFSAGAYSESRYIDIFEGLKKWGQSAPSVFVKNSSGPVTAKAAAIFFELNKEIIQLTKGELSLDDIVKTQLNNSKISLLSIQQSFKQLTGKSSQVLAKVP